MEMVEMAKFVVAKEPVIAIEVAEMTKFVVAKSELVPVVESVSIKEARPHPWASHMMPHSRTHTATRCDGGW